MTEEGPSMQEADRLHLLNDKPVRDDGTYVLYWMQSSQRTRFNHALERAIDWADELGQAVIVCFGLTDDYPEASERHYAFMLQGLADVQQSLSDRDIKLCVDLGDPADVAIRYARDASVLVGDVGYVRPCRRWRDRVADEVACRYEAVESEVVVPVEVASDKREFAARTIRKKLMGPLDDFLGHVSASTPKKSSLPLNVKGKVDVTDPDKLLGKLKIDRDVPKSKHFTGGETQARQLFDAFVEDDLHVYHEKRNEPAEKRHSYMSMFLHYGHVSPVELVRNVREAKGKSTDAKDAYVEEVVVRRELSKNFVWYSPTDYDDYKTLPDWARKTLEEHAKDKREHTYTQKQLEQSETHDEYWNAAMTQLRRTGFMHNYMRMYWGKKVLEWTRSPDEGHATLLAINNKWLIDGRDPNSYGNVAWCFGLHDRPWTERDIFGKVRYMNQKGLDRKFDMAAYVEQVDALGDD